jgi:hypothetical protein
MRIISVLLRKPSVSKHPNNNLTFRRSLKVALIATVLSLVACQTPTKKNLPKAKNPKEAALNFIDMLRQNHCDTALSFVSGTLKDTYQKMIDARGFSMACESWREQYLPYSVVEYTFEEEIGKDRKKVWLKLYKDVNGAYEVFSIEVENKSGRWWVVAV